MSEDVRRMSDELARDPGSRVFVPLGEALRRQGQLDVALKVTLRGLERHPHLADAHDLLARIRVDRGDLERAFDEWDMVLRLSPGHLGALKGMGFVCFQQGRFAEAEQYLAAASASGDEDEQVASALQHVRAAQTHATSPQATSRASCRRARQIRAISFADVLPRRRRRRRCCSIATDSCSRARTSRGTAATWRRRLARS